VVERFAYMATIIALAVICALLFTHNLVLSGELRGQDVCMTAKEAEAITRISERIFITNEVCMRATSEAADNIRRYLGVKNGDDEVRSRSENSDKGS